MQMKFTLANQSACGSDVECLVHSLSLVSRLGSSLPRTTKQHWKMDWTKLPFVAWLCLCLWNFLFVCLFVCCSSLSILVLLSYASCTVNILSLLYYKDLSKGVCWRSTIDPDITYMAGWALRMITSIPSHVVFHRTSGELTYKRYRWQCYRRKATLTLNAVFRRFASNAGSVVAYMT